MKENISLSDDDDDNSEEQLATMNIKKSPKKKV